MKKKPSINSLRKITQNIIKSKKFIWNKIFPLFGYIVPNMLRYVKKVFYHFTLDFTTWAHT